MTGRTCTHPGCNAQGQWKYCPPHWEQARTHLPQPPAHHVTPGTCHQPECAQPARLYPGGWLCDQHRPSGTTP